MTKCDRCLWSEQCSSPNGCEYFTPVSDDIDAVIEQNRYEFRQYWYEEYEDLSE